MSDQEKLANAIQQCFFGERVGFRGLPANVVDTIDSLANSAHEIANAISTTDSGPGQDAMGGHVNCLTESVMGITKGLAAIADSISDLAEAIREGHE